jgi:hypothetical protein
MKIFNLSQFCGAERENYIKNLQLALVSKLRKESRKNKPPLTGRVERSAEKIQLSESHFCKVPPISQEIIKKKK